ncbi:MAG TPA: flagellar motor protein MotB [Planctomycetota bacterium]|nr:flagellar motor protein MotB [Planctomycetota bacterium]
MTPTPSRPGEPAPIWLTTLSDMNMLLMVFFILLFSYLTQDKQKYVRLAESLEAISGPAHAGESRATGPADDGDADAAIFRAFEAARNAETEVARPRGHATRMQRLDEGTLLTLGGLQDAFPEGRWELTASQREALVSIKSWLAGRRNVIEIRGHTAANVQDAVVFEADGRVRAVGAEDLARPDRMAVANHSLLSWLRANEVRRFFAEEHPEIGDRVRFPDTQLRVRAEGYARALADSADPEARARNRRIEVLATSELAER